MIHPYFLLSAIIGTGVLIFIIYFLFKYFIYNNYKNEKQYDTIKSNVIKKIHNFVEICPECGKYHDSKDKECPYCNYRSKYI